MNERTNELRKKRRNENYLKLRKIGFSAKQATKMKDWSRNRISAMKRLSFINENMTYDLHAEVDKFQNKETNK